METVFFSVPVAKLEPVIKRWMREVLAEFQTGQSDKLLTIDQAAEFLHISKHTLYSKVSRKEVPCMKRGRRLYFSADDLTEWIKSAKKPTGDEIKANASEYLKQKSR